MATEAALRDALQRDPRNLEALTLLGVMHFGRGEIPKALEHFERAATVAPDNPTMQSNFGAVLRAVGRPGDAERCFRRAISVQPGHADANSNLGNLLRDGGRQEEAIQHFNRALATNPNHADAHNGLGSVLQDLGRNVDADAHYRRALAIVPTHTDALNNLANLLLAAGRVADAGQAVMQSLRVNPRQAVAQSILGNVCKLAGRPAEAVAAFRRALELDRALFKAHSNLIFALDLVEGSDVVRQQQERKRWSERHARRFAAGMKPHENRRDPKRRLRLGYVSADFKQHSAYYTFSPIIRLHDRKQVEVFCYSDVGREDEATAQLKAAADKWHATSALSDEALAAQIRDDRIDVLVDLAGHSAGNRLLVFARKPAPVQVTAWGHATGTGLETIDYLFTDLVVVPPAERKLFAEEAIDLPCVLCYEPPQYLPPVAGLPALRTGALTYGCVNRLEKITDPIIVLWGRILAAAPQARLLLKDKAFGDAVLRENFLSRLRNVGGIEAARVALHGSTPHREHLKVFHDIDIGLDPFPQGGGISTAEALWMGVPVVTLSGATLPSRITASLLTGMKLQKWIAHGDDEYVRIAVEMGRDLARLARLRRELRKRADASPCGDVKKYTRAVDKAYRAMWKRWCR